MSEETLPSEPASESVPQQPVSAPPKKNKRNLLLMIIAIIVAVLLVSVVLLAVDWGGDGEVERELQVTIHPSSVDAEAGEEVELYVSVSWVNVDDEDDSISLDADDDVEYRWARDPISLGSFDLTGRRYANITVQDSAGTGTVSCEVTYGEEVETVSAPVTVAAPYLASVSVVPATYELAVDEVKIFTATAYNSVDDPMTGVSFSWSVSGIASADYTLNATTGSSVTFSAHALATGTILLNATCTSGGITEVGTSEITTTSEEYPRSLEYRWYDMFEVPFGEWYDMRPDENPWTDWEGAPYIWDWFGNPVGNVWTYTNMRLDITGRNMTEINMNECPQFLPRLGTTSGGTAELDWYFSFTGYDELDPWPAIDDWNDGWISWLKGTTTLDMEATMSVLGMPAAEWDTFDTWWSNNNKSIDYLAWLNYEGDDRLDIYNCYEYQFADLDWWLAAEKVGEEVVVTQHLISWGFEALMARWLNESFMDDSEWWFEDFSLKATIHPQRADIDISTVVEYGAYAYETAEGGDPCWMWEALMNDYVESKPSHPYSRYDIYADLEYLNLAPGSPLYGDWMVYDYAPGAMNLSAGESMVFEWPEGDLPFMKHVQPGEYALEYGPMTVDYAEPMGVDFPGQVAIDTEDRTITYYGPIDMFDWSKTQTRCTGLFDEWVRLGVLPYGAPTVEFRLTGAPQMSSFRVEDIADPIVQGEASGVTVTALDQFGDVFEGYVGTITFDSSDPDAELPDDYTFQASDAGVHAFAGDAPANSVVLATVGEQWVSANDTVDDNVKGVQTDITVTEAPRAAGIKVANVTSPIYTGEASGFDIVILDQWGNWFPDYVGWIEFSSSDEAAEYPDPVELTAEDQGKMDFAGDLPENSVVFNTVGTHDLTARDQDDVTISGSQTGIVVNLAPHPDGFLITGITDPSYAAETQSYMTITVIDQYDNPFLSYTGTVAIECTDLAATYPTTAEFLEADQGVIEFTDDDYIEFGTAGTQTVTVTDSVLEIEGSVDVEVLPEAVATSFEVDVDPMTVALNTPCTVTVEVLDQYDRRFAPYAGTIEFSVEPAAGVTVPIDHTYDPGVDAGLYVTDDELEFINADEYTLTVTDGTITAQVEGIVATAEVIRLDRFEIELVPGSGMYEGTPCDVTVTAYNQFDNIFEDYAGTVEFSADPSNGVTLPTSDLTYGSGDEGVKTWPGGVVFDDPGTFSITVTDSVAVVEYTLEGIVVDNLVPTTLVIEGAPTTIEQDTLFVLTISVYDQNDDLEIDYEGTVHFSSSDTHEDVVLPIDYEFQPGDDGTVELEFLLMTPGSQTITAEDTVDAALTDTVTIDVTEVRSLDYRLYDMFAEEWGWWWGPREPEYYTDFIITTGEYNTMLYCPFADDSQGMIMAPYRWEMIGSNLPELNTQMPQFMPLEGPTTVTGDPVAEIDIYFQYLYPDWWTSYWEPTWSANDRWDDTWYDLYLDPTAPGTFTDGYAVGTLYTVTMNRPAAEMWLDMPQGADPATWWGTNSVAYTDGWSDWVSADEANDRVDIFCGYDDKYYPLGTMTELTVDGDDIVLEIAHLSWGYEVLMCRWLDDDDHGVNLLNHQTYYEDFTMNVDYTADDAQLYMDAVCQWSMFAVQQNESSSNDGAWVWQPIRIDYVTKQGHDSEYQPYETLRYESHNAGDISFDDYVYYDSTPALLELGERESLTIELRTESDVIGYLGEAVDQQGYTDLMEGGDPGAFDDIRQDGEMSLGWYVTDPAGDLDLESMWDTETNILTIEGPVDFDQVRYDLPDDQLWHGSPWIEFDITPVTMKAVESSEPIVGPVAEPSPVPSGAATGASALSELLALVVVVGAALLAIAALGCSMRRLNR